MGKKLGQHFLRSKAVIKKIIDTSGVGEGDVVFEIGPGKGALTDELLQRGAEVVLLEKDSELVLKLKEKYKNEIKEGRVKIQEGDIRDGLPKLPRDYVVVSNIPYYITGQILRQLLESKNNPKKITLLVQKEVGERIAKSKKESLLSLSVKCFGRVQYKGKVSASAFSPPPRVDSAIIHIFDICKPNPQFIKLFFQTIHEAFKNKRKMITSNIKDKKILSLLEKEGVSSKERAENIPYEIWKKIVEKQIS